MGRVRKVGKDGRKRGRREGGRKRGRREGGRNVTKFRQLLSIRGNLKPQVLTLELIASLSIGNLAEKIF